MKPTQCKSKMRLDKWLWAARFFKTRSLAGEQVRGGKVLLSGLPVKSSRDIKSGDSITIKRHGFDQVYEVLSIPKARIGAPEAQLLYEETAESLTKREKEALARKAAGGVIDRPAHRPTKKQRRQIHNFKDSSC